ncbi:MAG: UDP-N-acetylmuramoyl-L-alanyl-D-glutamate--2,6-diaminopimelate ligase, partial [Candidatus Omnitrophica bacterium]|nr:UDP-N-acetylmuramoyl-L-alanyl-D-glutamate--2,6-diaminopimelate ligase [Candidatus Omnitrophota bacterium]
MLLKELLCDLSPSEIPQSFQKFLIKNISSDSRSIEEGSLFVAVKGPTMDGHEFIQDAIRRGARVIVKNGERKDLETSDDVYFLSVDHPQEFLSKLLNRFYSHPVGQITSIGITGTNGKTTITYLLEAIFSKVGKKCGVIGTVNYRIGQKILPAKNTTPGIVDLYRYFDQMRQEGVSYCAMEVSSHALVQQRVKGIGFHYAIFSNLTSDHMDYHRSQEDYFQAKALLFTSLSVDARAIINVDDPFGQRLIKMCPCPVIGYGIQEDAQVSAKNIETTFKGTTFVMRTPQGEMKVKTSLIGVHNVYNILAAVTVALEEGFALDDIRQAIENFQSVPGRLEQIDEGQDFHVFVDYAHTEDALKNVMSSLRAVTQAKIILVFGCGGDRDKTKRAPMGRAASRLASWTVLAMD